MNILLTAADSFVSRTILKHLGGKHNIDSFSHKDLDLTNINRLEEILNNKPYDYLINPAISGQGRLLKEDSCEDFYNNMLMTENIMFLRHKFGHLLTFSSGAGNNRNKDIINLKEGEFYTPPLNKYSLAKYLVHRRIYGYPNVTNLRIFNLFGQFERPDRFIKSSINKYINKENIEIWGDAYFDFFGENDFITVLEHVINNPVKFYVELNLVYKEKKKLSEIVDIINNLSDYKVDVKILDNGINKHYTGNGDKLNCWNLPLLGLNEEIKIMYNQFKNE